MINAKVTDTGLAHLISLPSVGNADSRHPFMRLDYDKPIGAIYISFLKASGTNEHTPSISQRSQAFIDEVLVHIKNIDELLNERRARRENRPVGSLFSLFTGVGPIGRVDGELKFRKQAIYSTAERWTGEGLSFKLEFAMYPV